MALRLRLIALALTLAALTAPVSAAGLPQGPGLAARYPGDKGISKDEAVVFADGFESYESPWEGDWPPSWGGGIPPTTGDRKHVDAGKRALELTVRAGQTARAECHTWYDAGTFRGSTGYEQMYARWYVMFSPGLVLGELDQAFGSLVGMRNHWYLVQFKPERKPDGTDLFAAAVGPMGSAQGVLGTFAPSALAPNMTPNAEGHYDLIPNLSESPLRPVPGRWYCVEIMLKPNTPGQEDGEMAVWVDGVLHDRAAGLRLRTTDNLKINGFWLQLALRKPARTGTVWCDDVVVAKSYIGPMAGR
jgi:hypothetical protein